jgi:hypothetical protein
MENKIETFVRFVNFVVKCLNPGLRPMRSNRMNKMADWRQT